jgi:hypothetical protein
MGGVSPLYRRAFAGEVFDVKLSMAGLGLCLGALPHAISVLRYTIGQKVHLF